MRLSARDFTLPWQLVELQEPGPVYLPASAEGFAALGGFSEAKKNRAEPNHGASQHQSLGLRPDSHSRARMQPAFFAWAVEPALVRIFILPVRIEVNQSKVSNFQGGAAQSGPSHCQDRNTLDIVMIIIVST